MKDKCIGTTVEESLKALTREQKLKLIAYLESVEAQTKPTPKAV